MNRKKQLFRYGRSHKIVHWGCAFDSLTELKYAISIMEEYEFLRARVTIYYHPGTKLPTDYIRECHRHYTPDFLIRHKHIPGMTGEEHTTCVYAVIPVYTRIIKMFIFNACLLRHLSAYTAGNRLKRDGRIKSSAVLPVRMPTITR